jgi:hypothetical protein
MANFFAQFGSGPGLAGTSFVNPTDVDALPLEIKNSAFQLGIDPKDLATAISYETAGTFNKAKKGPTTKWGLHEGLIQWGQPQQKQYGIDVNGPSDEQMMGVTQYLKNAGVQPGMGLDDVYSAINAGRVGRPNASDRPGKTVTTHVADMTASHMPGAQAFIGETGQQPQGNFFAKFHPEQAAATPQPSSDGKPWGDVAGEAASNAPGDLWHNLYGIASQLASPGGQAGVGYELATNPEARKAVGEHYTNYGSVEGIKENIAKTPVSTFLDITGLLTPFKGGPAVNAEAKLSRATAPLTAEAQAVEAGSRIGVDVPAFAVAKPVTQSIARKLSDVPIIGTPVEKASKKAVSQLESAAKSAETMFGSGDIPKAGEASRAALTGYIRGESAANVSKAYDRVDNLVNPEVARPLSATAKVATEIGRIREASAAGPSRAASLVQDAIAREGGLTYEGVKGLRTQIGEMLDTGVLPADTSGKELKRIYGALTDDLRETIRHAGGPKAVSTWERANQYNRLVSARRENLMRVLGAPSDEAVVERLTATAGSKARADIKLLTQARKAAGPDAWRELASAVISRMGKAPGSDFSPSRFFTAYDKMTQASRRVLFRSTGNENLGQYIDDIATVSRRFKDIEQYANTSRTAAANATFGMAATAASSAGAVLTGTGLAAPLVALTTAVGGNILARLLARPASAKVLRDWVRAYEVKARSGSPAATKAYVLASRALSQMIAETQKDQ